MRSDPAAMSKRRMEPKRIGEILVDLHVLEPSDIERVLAALRRRGGRAKFGHVAKDMGLVREEHILAALAVQLQLIPGASDLTLAHLLKCLADPATPPPRARSPERFARRR
jgi:hypothetical protein